MDFEKKLAELEATVQKLEDKDLPLEEGILLFEKGMNLTKDCLKSLFECKGKVEVIRKEMDGLALDQLKGE